jgi:lipopolysaccharide/colanic/teichoic acid biosynthesis glycosyltransferase
MTPSLTASPPPKSVVEGRTRAGRLGTLSPTKPAAAVGVAELVLDYQSLSSRQMRYERVKRVIDVVLALTALIILSPLMLLVAVLIRLCDWGPVLFAQTRVGQGGREFRCYKFRSMIPNAEALKHKILGLNAHSDPRTFKVAKDPRITFIGGFIRKTSIDELPQLFNVLKGDMSIVGPRPPLPSEVANYSPSDLRRLVVRPGLTCIWQVSGRGDVSFDRQIELDVHYIENRSFLLDFKLILLTIPAVIMGRGAY